jgi:hypothetical protein
LAHDAGTRAKDANIYLLVVNNSVCSVCPGRSVCLEWRRSLSLRLDYEDILGALECLEDVLDKPAWRFSLGGNDFCACHAGNGSFYLVCREHVVLRLSEDEARLLRCELAGARDALDQEARTLWERISEDCTMKNTTHPGNAMAWMYRAKGGSGERCMSLWSMVWLKPYTAVAAISSDMKK